MFQLAPPGNTLRSPTMQGLATVWEGLFCHETSHICSLRAAGAGPQGGGTWGQTGNLSLLLPQSLLPSSPVFLTTWQPRTAGHLRW